MTILGELAAELIGMFAGEKRLTLAVLVIVGVAGALVDFVGLNQLLGGAVLLLGSLAVLVESVLRGARSRMA